MKNRQQALFSIVIGIAIVFGIIIGQVLNFDNKKEIGLKLTQKDKINKLLQYIEDEYVDAVQTDSILEVVIKDILKNLDPHSVYIPQKEVEMSDEEINGEFTGIGVLFQKFRDTFTIIRPLKNSPAQKAGLQIMDRILKVNNDTVYGNNTDTNHFSSLIKGRVGTKIKLTIYRKSKDSVFDVNITREKIPLVSVPAHFMLNDTIGFIKISSFSADTYDEFHQAILVLKQKGMKSLVLDLRDNTGGLLKQADLIADEFLPNGTLIFFTKKKKRKIQKVVATSRGDFESGSVYVLINENTASASEVLAGALQDNDRATIIGRRSYGKGLIQREIELGDGSKIRLTTAHYYTPTGRSIQRPYQKGHKKEYEQKFQNRQYNGELYYKDSIPINDSLKYTTPKGKIVYGGGGIIPDLFVPLNRQNFLFQHTSINNYISGFTTNYLDNHLAELQNYTEEEFINDPYIADKIYQSFIDTHKLYAKNIKHKKSKNNEKQKRLIKAILARDLFGANAYYRIILADDPMIKEVLKPKKNEK